MHNSQVEDYKKFKIGEVDNKNENVYIGIQRGKTWNVLKQKLVDKLGGEFNFRVLNGELYIDYLMKIGEEKENSIELSKNMKSIIREKNPAEYITRLIPLGCKLDNDTEERLEISDVNNGKNFIDDYEAIKKYGIHVGYAEFDDVTTAADLLVKGTEWLVGNNKLKINYKATALDLSLIGLDIADFNIYNTYPLINSLLGIDDTVRIIKQNIDICNEIESAVEFGEKFKTFGELQKEAADSIFELSQIPIKVINLQEDLLHFGMDLTNKLGKDENDYVVQMLNASASVIIIDANRLIIESDNFKLSADGIMEANKGNFGNWTINDNGMISCELGSIDWNPAEKAALTMNAIVANVEMSHNVSAQGLALGRKTSSSTLGCTLWGDRMLFYDTVSNYEGSFKLDPRNGFFIAGVKIIIGDDDGIGNLNGVWYYGEHEIATKADIQELSEHISALGKQRSIK